MKVQMEVKSILKNVKIGESKRSSNKIGFYFFLGADAEQYYKKIISTHAWPNQKKDLLALNKETLHFFGKKGFVWIQRAQKVKTLSHNGLFGETSYGAARDGLGALVPHIKSMGLTHLNVQYVEAKVEEVVGGLVGLDLGAYQFKAYFDGKNPFEGLPEIYVSSVGEKVDSELILTAEEISVAVNSARHLTNLPGNILNPDSFQKFVTEKFKKVKEISLEVLDEAALAKEGMGLHLAVGQGAQFGPRLLILKYRPKGLEKEAPIAFVGKGITFDTGGLDIKPSSAMRWMKKDMGGAAAVVGVALWVAQVKPLIAIDFYLPLAENAVDALSYRPGDIVKARNGMTVEIHNTDAEGRLVLADAIDKATDSKPKFILDVATLTGAIKVALGADLPGLFSNHDELAEFVAQAGIRGAEVSWRMPLFPKYASQMNSSFATMTNSVDGFGGAITAAMFLERFVKDIPWAHLDIYSWADKPHGAINSVGGNGQGVQTLAALISIIEKNEGIDFT